MKITNFGLSKIKFYLNKFENSENKFEGIYFLKELLLLLKKEENKDNRVKIFLNKIQEEFNFNLDENWKEIKLDFPEINSNETIQKYLFVRDILEKNTTNNETAWNYLQKKIVSMRDTGEVMFGQMVQLRTLN